MLKRIFAGLLVLTVTANFLGEAIAQPSKAYEPNKRVVTNISSIIEQKTEPSKSEIAKKQIAQRREELEKVKQIELEQQKQAEIARQKQIEETNKARIVQASAARSGNVEIYRAEVAKYPWPVEEALLTMKLESGGNPKAISRTNDHGLFQIHNGYQMYGEKIYDPAFNIALAYNNYYKTRGWTPWYAVAGILH